MSRIPIVMDCDPGTDDALAMLMAAADENIKIKAITTVAGNLNKIMTSHNALKITEYFGIDVPVGEGAYPICKKFEPLDVEINGLTGLGDADVPEPKKVIDKRTSVQILYDEAVEENGKLVILATGPLTNVALLICEHPEVRKLVKRIVIMGGAVHGGNLTPKAEFNIYTDAEAAKIVFQSGIPITMVGLEVCYGTPMYKEDFDKLLSKKGKASDFIAGLMYYPGSEKKPFPKQGLFIYDALAAVALIDPQAVEFSDYYVDVETRGELTYGQTVVDTENYLKKEPNTTVVTKIDKNKFMELVQKTICYFQGAD